MVISAWLWGSLTTHKEKNMKVVNIFTMVCCIIALGAIAIGVTSNYEGVFLRAAVVFGALGSVLICLTVISNENAARGEWTQANLTLFMISFAPITAGVLMMLSWYVIGNEAAYLTCKWGTWVLSIGVVGALSAAIVRHTRNSPPPRAER
jgi:hypothetical protein